MILKNKMFKNIVFLILLILTTQESTIDGSSEDSKSSSSSSNSKLTKIEIFIYILCVVIFLVLLFICLSKILIIVCQRYSAFEKLMQSYVKDELAKNNNLLNQIRFVYGLKYIFLFLYDKIFKSTTYRADKIKYLGNCTICLNDFNEKDKIYITSCEHIYHKKCMENYLELIKKEIEKNEGEIENFSSYFHCPNCKGFLFANKKIKFISIDIQKNCNENKNIVNNNIVNNININVNNFVNNENKDVDSNNITDNIDDEINDKEEIKNDKYSVISSNKMKNDSNSTDNISSNSLRQMKITHRRLRSRALRRKYRSKIRNDTKNNYFNNNPKYGENFSTKSLQEGDSNLQQSAAKLKKYENLKNSKESIRIIRNHNNNLMASSLDFTKNDKIKEDDNK